MIDRAYCASSYLAFRYVVRAGTAWAEGVVPATPSSDAIDRTEVDGAPQALAALQRTCSGLARDGNVGLLLSSGIDSAILARLLPPGTPCYTARFVAPNAVDESEAARHFAEASGHPHVVVDVSWGDYLATVDHLMFRKRSPLHPIEPALLAVAARAAADGIRRLVVGNGADTTFGGLDRLLCSSWRVEDFVHRYTFLEPSRALLNPVDVEDAYSAHRRGAEIDVPEFLRVVHGTGIVQVFENGIGAAGCTVTAPYEQLRLRGGLDLDRIRSGESKYVLRQIFADLYPNLPQPAKVAFARPMESWMATWPGPARPEFRGDLDVKDFSGEQRWLLYCLDRFLSMLDDWRPR